MDESKNNIQKEVDDALLGKDSKSGSGIITPFQVIMSDSGATPKPPAANTPDDQSKNDTNTPAVSPKVTGVPTPEEIKKVVHQLRTLESDVASLKGEDTAEMQIPKPPSKKTSYSEPREKIEPISLSPQIETSILSNPFEESVSYVAKESDQKSAEPPAPETPDDTVPVSSIPKKPVDQTQEQKKPQNTIRTYTSDVAEAVKSDNTSMVQIALAEAKKKQAEIQEEKPETLVRNLSLILLSILLIIVGGYTVYYFGFKAKPNLVNTNPDTRELINSENKREIASENFTRENMTQALASEIGKLTHATSQVTRITFAQVEKSLDGKETKRLLTPEDVFSYIAPNSPSSLVRSFEPNYFFGIYDGRVGGPFIIVKTNSYDTAFAGMLQWESTILLDFENIFLKPEDRVTDPSVRINMSRVYPFSDAVIENKDIRLVKSPQGNILLLYTFLDRNTLVITANEETLREAIDRLRTAKFVR